MKPYPRLTPEGRRRRIRAIVAPALARFGITPVAVRRLPGDTNAVYVLRTGEGRRLVLRIGRPGVLSHGTEQIRSEIAWLEAIADSGIRAPVPIAAPNGERVVEVAVPGVPGDRPCVVFEWIPGRSLQEHPTGDNLMDYGELMARLHEQAARYRPGAHAPRPRHDQVFPYEEPVVLFGGDHPYFPPERRAVFVMAAARVEDAITDLIARGEPMRVIHGDLHVWNVLVSRRGPAALDFEDHLWGWPIQDLGIALYYLEGRSDFAEMVGLIRRGYERVAAWPASRPEMLRTCIAARSLVLANGVVHLHREGSMPRAEAGAFFDRAEARLRRLLPALS